MPSSAILDVAIGISFVYLFLSLICSVVNEGIASVFSLRAKNLVAGINSLFSGAEAPGDTLLLVQKIYQHGLIRGLFKDPPTQVLPDPLELAKGLVHVNLPSYIPSQTFVTALLDIMVPSDGKSARTLQQVRDAVGNLSGPTKQALTSLLADTEGDNLAEFQQKVENWFNDSMERASGWYKRQAQRYLLVIALLVTVGLNVDTIKLAQLLWGNPVAREAAVDLAKKYVDNHQTPTPTDQDLATRQKELVDLGKQLPIPLGWQGGMPKCDLKAWLETVAGWLITTLALSLGAPFWFDTLNRFMSLRSAAKPKVEEKDQGKKDNAKGA